MTDGDLIVDPVVPVCVDSECTDSQILVLPSATKKVTIMTYLVF